MPRGRKLIPEGKTSINIEVWENGKENYIGQMTVHIDESVGLDGLVKSLETQLRSSSTRLIFKDRLHKKSKTVTLHYGAEHVKREIQQIAKEI